MSVLSQAQRRRLKVQTLCSPAGRSPEKKGHTHFKTHRTVRFIVLSLKRFGWDTVEPWLKSGTIWASDLSPDNWKNTMKKKNKKNPKWIETDSQWLLLRDAFGAFSFLQNFRIFTVLKKKKKYHILTCIPTVTAFYSNWHQPVLMLQIKCLGPNLIMCHVIVAFYILLCVFKRPVVAHIFFLSNKL